MFSERRRIVDLWKSGDAAALATLVGVEGSSYRRPGARLLITKDGSYAGAISGGCLEAEVLRKAQWMVRNGAVSERYSTLFDDTADIPYGLGCGGTVDVLLEPAGTPEFDALMQAFSCSLEGKQRTVTSWLEPASYPEGGKLHRLVLDDDAKVLFRTGNDVPEPSWIRFEEVLRSPQRLLIFGAGDDAQPVTRFASLLGWNVVVIDGRAQWAKAERFPHAVKVFVAQNLNGIPLTHDDAAVIMTHSYEQDRAWLSALLPFGLKYLGLLGARHRSALLLTESSSRLGWSLEQTCMQVVTPIGLDLGGDGAEAIALAIISEIQACIEGKLLKPRRLCAESVSALIMTGDSSRYRDSQCAL